MSRRTKAILLAGVVLLLAMILAAIMTYLLNKPSNRVIAQWEQPASITYSPRAPFPFRLIVIERNTDWSDLLYQEKTYYIYLGNEYPYGHRYRFPFYYREHEVESKIKASTVEWSDEGVTLRSTLGEVLFVPRDVFAGE